MWQFARIIRDVRLIERRGGGAADIDRSGHPASADWRIGIVASRHLAEQDYLDLDRAAEYKSGFGGGEMNAMIGGNVCAHLKSELKAGCRAFPSVLRIRTPNGDYFYPDVTVNCGQPQAHAGSTDICTNPALIVEVLSPSSADFDRSFKFHVPLDPHAKGLPNAPMRCALCGTLLPAAR